MGSGEEYLDSLLAALSSEQKESEKIQITPVSDDPNKALGADEIAALFAQANVDMETGEEVASVDTEEVLELNTEDSSGELAMPEMEDMGMSLDDMLAGMLGDEEDADVDNADEATKNVVPLEEIEIDMNNPEELELLLGIGEKKDRRKPASQDIAESSEDEILLAMGEENPDLNEINHLLNKLDHNELVDEGIEESMLVDFSDMESDSEQDPWLDELLGAEKASGDQKKEKKKRKFPFFGKKGKAKEVESETVLKENLGEESEEEIQDILSSMTQEESDIPLDLFADFSDTVPENADGELELLAMVEDDDKKEKETKVGKKSFLAKIFEALTEEIPDEEEEENIIFEGKSGKGKKGKKNKKGKSPVTDAEDNEGILEELDAEEKGGKKKKKEKKPKKEKKQKKVEELPPEIFGEKKLPVKMVVRIFALCFSIMALLLLVMHYAPLMWSVAEGRNAFYKQDYEKVYEEFSGKELSDSDQRLYEKSKMIIQLSHKMDAYENYKKMNFPVEALDSLLSGYMLWQKLGDKIAEYDAVSETNEVKEQIVTTLMSEYMISEQEIIEINLLDNYDYTMRLEEITGSKSRRNGAVSEEIQQEQTEELQTEDMTQAEELIEEPTTDVLPEEEVK